MIVHISIKYSIVHISIKYSAEKFELVFANAD